MKDKLGVPPGRPLADFLPTVTIKAKDFAAEITNFQVRQQNLGGEEAVAREHVKNNADVRQVLTKRGIVPESLPAARRREEDRASPEKRGKDAAEAGTAARPRQGRRKKMMSA